jgi:hypothetical protein
MTVRRIGLIVAVLAGCATSSQRASLESASGPRDQQVREESSSTPPAFFSLSPWAMKRDLSGEMIHIQKEAGLQFSATAGELDRQSVRIYDEKTNDVGINYGGAVPVSKPECLISLSVYVYPATEPLPQHLEAVRTELLKANPEARPTANRLSLDASHGGSGVHGGYLNNINSLDSFEGIDLYQRGRWFIKYRVTVGPANKSACEERIRDAVSALQIREN